MSQAKDEICEQVAGKRAKCPVVGLGASAGGLEAFQQFLDHMPPNSGIAFVLIQHLDPHHETLMPELLSKHTTMRVKRLEDGQAVEADHVYVAPSNAVVLMSGCRLQAGPPPGVESRRMPIDEFFRSLARDQEENVIGVVLSGTGSDGTLGLRAIKNEGGLTMAQSPELAKYDSMPRSAISSGVVDHVLPVQQMPGVILEYMRHVSGVRQEIGGTQSMEKTLAGILRLLQRKSGHDFSRYKQSTLLRRIQRRMQVTYTRSMQAYAELLRHSVAEAEELFKDLLIGVTQFFRDPGAFEAIEAKVLPEIFREKQPEDPVRLWVPGCATGEEAYSFALLLADFMAAHGLKNRVQIFGTDIDEEALEVARKALYPETAREQVPGARMGKQLLPRDGAFEVAEPVREMCLFSMHNLIKDPPFSHLDLISCRNLLIYMEADLQRRLLPLFHYALNPSGFLFLGPSENVAARSELFHVVEKKHRIFQRKPAMLRPVLHFPALAAGRTARLHAAPPAAPLLREQTVVRTIERVLLEELAPPALVINEQGDVLYFSGPIGDYLQPGAGVPSNKALNLVRKSLRVDLRTTIQRALSTRQTAVREHLRLRLDGEMRHINLVVRPLTELAKEELFLIAFQNVPATAGAGVEPTAIPPGEATHPVIHQLETELRVTKEELQNTIEELETSNEELRSANEELLSMNEELQSTNEEMQTSREELQSVNEELQRKMEELDVAHSDLQNLVQSSQVPTLFLDPQLRIRKFTPALAGLATVSEQDLGKTLAVAAPHLARPRLIGAASEAMRSLKAQEEHLWLEEQRAWYIVRVTPYRTLDQTVLGAVMTFTNITELKRAQEHRSELAAIVEGSQDAILGIGLDCIIRAWNKGAELMYGWQAQEVVGRPGSIIVPRDRQSEWETLLERVKRGESITSFETVRLTKSLQPIEVSLTLSAIRDAAGAITGISSIARDITERNRAELTSRLLAGIVESSDDAIVSKDLNGIITSWNAGARRLLGFTAEEIIGQPVTTFIPLERHPEETLILSRIRKGERLDHFETVRQRKDGTLIDVSLTVSPIKNAQGRIVGASKIARNITERKQAERLLAEAQARLAQTNQDLEERVQQRTQELADSNSQLESLVYSIAHDLRAPLRAMQSFATILVEEYGPVLAQTGQEYARRIMRSAESLDQLILDLLAYARLGQSNLELSAVSVEACWAAALAQNSELIERRKAVVETARPVLQARANPATLTQVLSNLLSNALRFVPPERTPQIRLRTDEQSGAVRVWVEDNGIGIEPKFHERIFAVFQQLHGKKYGGTGVGLAIVRRGVERMGGRVGLESTPGEGTRFWIELPSSAT